MVVVEPDSSGCYAGDCSEERNPPEDACDGVAVLGEARKPVGATVVEENMVER